MSYYQLRLLSDMSDIGEPGALPAAVRHLTDPELADLSWLVSEPQYDGKGFFPVDAEVDATRWLRKAILLQRIPLAKRSAIRAARGTDPIVDDFLYLLEQSDRVDLDNENVAAGFGYLVSQGLLTQEEADAALA